MIKTFLLSLIVYTSFFLLFLPKLEQTIELIHLIIGLSILNTFFLKRLNIKKQKINLGLILFLAMNLIAIVGNASQFIIQFVFPMYDTKMYEFNIYWMTGMFFLSVGYLIIIKKRIKLERFYKPANIIYIRNTLVIVIIATMLMYLSMGVIPFFQKLAAGERIMYDGITILPRLWSLCVVSGALSFHYIKTKKELHPFAWIILILSIIISLYFLIRMYPFLLIISLGLVWFYFEQSNRKKNVVILLGVSAFFILNSVFKEYRDGSGYGVEQSTKLNYVQKDLFTNTFNEFGQLKRVYNDYDEDFKYGTTLLSLPLSFVPGTLIEPFGITKSEIQKNNSAIIIADWMNSKTSSGIRTGIMGEFFINFGASGCFFMIFFGFAVGALQNKINRLDPRDYRLVILLILFGVFLYSLIGQIDAIGSLLGNFILFYLIFNYLTDKKYIHGT